MVGKLFFSSCFEDPLGTPLPVRERIKALNPAVDPDDTKAVAALPIWMAENYPILDRDSPTPPLNKAIFCVEGVRDCDVYVAVARSRHGSGIDFSFDARLQTSYFELELYEAAVLRKPAYVFLQKGAEPEGRLAALLDLLAPSLPGFCREPLSQDEIFKRIEEILAEQRRPHIVRKLRLLPQLRSGIVDRLTRSRFHPYEPSADLPPLRFLNDMTDVTAKPPDEHLVESIIERAGNEPNHHSKLMLLWMAIRELMGAPLSQTSSKKIIALWDRSLSRWTSVGAWFGLHGHPYMGCLASLGSQSAIRNLSGDIRDVPHGPLASEYYSIASKISERALKQRILAVSRKHVDVQFDVKPTSGVYALRGSIKWAQGDREGSIEDYFRVLELREGDEHAGPGQVGEAMTELGFALLRSGQRGRGLSYLERGTEKLKAEPPNGFQVRAIRKLGRAYLLTGSPRAALRTLDEGYRVATRLGLYDKIGALDRLGSWIENALWRNHGRKS